jgi:hypothetical protein
MAHIGIAVVGEHLGTEAWWYTDGVTFKCLAPDVTLYAGLWPVHENVIGSGWLGWRKTAGEDDSRGEHDAGKSECGSGEFRASKVHRDLDKIGRVESIVLHRNHPDPAAAPNLIDSNTLSPMDHFGPAQEVTVRYRTYLVQNAA